MKRGIKWQAYSSGNRNEIIRLVQEAISKNDGCIMNFNMFSDLALSMSIEIEESRIIELHNVLNQVVKIENFESNDINPNSKKEGLIFLNLSFTHGKGKLKMEIPNVPG